MSRNVRFILLAAPFGRPLPTFGGQTPFGAGIVAILVGNTIDQQVYSEQPRRQHKTLWRSCGGLIVKRLCGENFLQALKLVRVPERFAEEPMVCRLLAGGRRIRTVGPTAKGMAMGNHSRQASPSRTCKWLRPSCRGLRLATPRRASPRSGTDGSNPLSSSGESANHRFLSAAPISKALVHVPSHLSFAEAATLPCAAVTAWVALTGHRRVTAGDTVLTQGSGGVSVFALQFARLLGARVLATTSTPEKAERLKALGASDVINYSETPDWDEKARELTDGRGVDCVVEVGGPGTVAASLKALAAGGHVSLIGASLSLSGTGLDPLLLTGRGVTLSSISVGSRADFETMNRAIALHRLHPVIDRTFPFAQAKEAYRHFEGRGHFGKVVITHG